MNNSIITGRYAKALLGVGIERECLEALKDDMSMLAATISTNPMFVQLLDSPVIKPQQKHGVMDELLSKRVNKLTLSFIHVLIRNRREIMLADVARRFIALYEAHKGIKHARISSAAPLDAQVLAALQKQLNVLYNADVQLAPEINPDLIGGFVLNVDDRQYDASVATGLKRMRQAMRG